MKSLIKYSDYLMKTRGKIEPKVGDIVKLFSSSMSDHTISKINYPHNDNSDLINLVFSEDCDWEYLGNCYVEIDLPEIEWKYSDIYTNHQGFFNRFQIMFIEKDHYGRDNFHLNYGKGKQCGPGVFSGTLNECKLKAEELLWK